MAMQEQGKDGDGGGSQRGIWMKVTMESDDVHPNSLPPLLDVREPQEISVAERKAPNGPFISIN